MNKTVPWFWTPYVDTYSTNRENGRASTSDSSLSLKISSINSTHHSRDYSLHLLRFSCVPVGCIWIPNSLEESLTSSFHSFTLLISSVFPVTLLLGPSFLLYPLGTLVSPELFRLFLPRNVILHLILPFHYINHRFSDIHLLDLPLES